MARLQLTHAAAKDFEDIFAYGIEIFGEDQAIRYQIGLKQRFMDIAQNPLQYPQVDHIAAGYRRSIYGSHAIYFKFAHESILIVRILGQQNPDAAF